MADIEEGQHGDKGRMRDWLARAVRAPADEVWIADGQVSEEWLPMSPVTGKIDGFEWKAPVAQMSEQELPTLTVKELHEQAKPLQSPGAESTSSSSEDIIDAEVTDVEAVPVYEAKDQNADPIPEADNVVSIDEAKSDKTKSSDEVEDSGEAASMSKNTGPYKDSPKVDLERRPDDPGPHPDKEPPKKKMKLF